MIAQLAVLCSPVDVEIAVFVAPGTAWTWMRWLPHVRGRIATTPAEHDAVVDELIDLARTPGLERGLQPPWLVVLIDGAEAVAASRRLWPLLDGRPHLAALFVVGHVGQLPGSAQVVRVEGETGGTVRFGDAAIVADGVTAPWAEDVARALAPLRDAEADPATALPSACRLAALLGDEPPRPETIFARWQAGEQRCRPCSASRRAAGSPSISSATARTCSSPARPGPASPNCSRRWWSGLRRNPRPAS